MRFEHLADVHARRHAQRIQYDVHRRPIRQEGHVFFGDDLGDHAFVAVAPRHFVADREFALRGDINFDRFDDTAISALAGFRALQLLIVLHLHIIKLLFEGADDFIDFVADG